MSEHQEQMEPIIMLERMAKGQDATLYPEQRDAIKCLLDRVKELEQQRAAALKLADEFDKRCAFATERGLSVLASAWHGASNQLRAIYAPKEQA